MNQTKNIKDDDDVARNFNTLSLSILTVMRSFKCLIKRKKYSSQKVFLIFCYNFKKKKEKKSKEDVNIIYTFIYIPQIPLLICLFFEPTFWGFSTYSILLEKINMK